MTPSPPNSPNFSFLGLFDDVLVRHAALAERYVFDDPNSALIKLRQFAELLADHCAAFSGIAVMERDSLLDTINKLRDGRVCNYEVAQVFHQLRKSGNDAAHANAGDRREALQQLRMAHKLAIWFYASFSGDRSFKRPTFVPPPDPNQAAVDLQVELERLREALAAAQATADGAQASAEEHAQQRQAAEAAAEKAYEDLNAALDLAAETEQQLLAEQAQFREKLKLVQAEVAAAPAEQREQVAAVALEESQNLDLDETDTRRIIDSQLRDAGWEADSETFRYAKGTRPVKGRNLAIAEWPTDSGPADYCLFVGLTPVAVVEAKRQNKNCAGAIVQAKRYSRDIRLDETLPSNGGPWENYRIPFLFSTNGRPFLRQIQELSGIWFLDVRHNHHHSRALESWYSPEGLTQLLAQDQAAAQRRLEKEPFDYLPLRDYQVAAIREVEQKIAEGRRDMLVAMATGTGKTRTCIAMIYRLIKLGRFRRVLFLVDRSALGEQTSNALKDLRIENYQSFSDIYDVKQLGDLRPDTETKLHIATVQGMVKRLLYPEENSPPVPVDWYDCIVVDECHRGYNLDQEMSEGELAFRSESDYISKYRRVIDHFDAVRIGLTATPALHTTEIFGAPIYQYSYRQAVVDGWLVDHEPPHRIITKLSEEGIRYDRGDEMKYLDSDTNQLELFNTPDEVNFEVEAFNRKVLTENFNSEVCKVLTDYIDPTLPGKTLVFCVNDLHADMVVRLLKESLDDAYGAIHDDAVIKITGAADKPLQLIRRFKNEQLPNVVVTVDLLTTGIDIPSIVNLVFLRRVKSRILFEQMLGRATRLCTDLYAPGEDKERFQIFDAVDLYAQLQDVSQMRPVVTKANISFSQLVTELCEIDDEKYRIQIKDQILAKLQRKKLSDSQQQRLETATGMNRQQLIQHIQATPPAELAAWLRDRTTTGEILDDVRPRGARYVVSDHPDEFRRIDRGYGEATRPEDYLEAFRNFVTEHLNDLPALLVVAQRPRDLTRKQLKELRLALDEAGFTESNLQTAWRETTNQDIAASIIGYIRHVACGQPLLAHKDRVQAAMKQILASRAWTAPQRIWLERIGKQLEQEVIVDREALESGQFKQQGGFSRLDKIFKGELAAILREIADAVWQAA
ncbi:type I restriction-modification system endonuclease [Blastopirellula sp. JC732]|uniref:Type I restriction-modification system endonuclease n=1 Tax=Blastopirellula sediminis TaxID=2894196 RepID=A0A9X1SHD8_9BACT|nr:type I restriction-modification system endonuclease [Blastopirellula sediminis]MCC9608088.1 type I restriction-modification system endonuclease [Blastopirellula sediminis]MCC9627119.1 type I restriction-modification system endonuclease [Blastopirellula sediminis]